MSLEYWSPSRQKYYASLYAVQVDFPHTSLPLNMDMPDLDVYQIHWPDPMPEVEEGYSIEWSLPPTLMLDGKYYQSYIIVPKPVEV